MPRTIVLTLLGGSLLMQGCARGSQPTVMQSTTSATSPQLPPVATPVGPCAASELKLTVQGRNGDYAGMSHDGALLVLHNTSHRTCRVSRRPQLLFSDASGKPVPLRLKVPPGMHPGPVIAPMEIAAGAEIQGKVRWVTGPVYDTNTCVDTAQLSIAISGGQLQAPFPAHICGPSQDKLEYEQEFMQAAAPSD